MSKREVKKVISEYISQTNSHSVKNKLVSITYVRVKEVLDFDHRVLIVDICPNRLLNNDLKVDLQETIRFRLSSFYDLVEVKQVKSKMFDF